MGLGGISPWSLVLILVIVLLLFGTKKLRGLGGDLGGALKGFKKAMSDDDAKKDESPKKVEDDSEASEEAPSAQEKTEASEKDKVN